MERGAGDGDGDGDERGGGGGARRWAAGGSGALRQIGTSVANEGHGGWTRDAESASGCASGTV